MAFAGDGLSGAPETLLDAGLEASSAADATLAADAGFPAAARHFATWVLSIAILAAAAVVTGAATAVGRLRRN
jgi:hypothetical protein